MAKAKNGNPEVPPEMTDRNRIARGILTGLAEQGFAVTLRLDGTVGVHMPESDYVIKVTKKKERLT